MAPHEREDLEKKLPSAVNNRGLFSEYYLTTLVWEDPFFSGSKKEAERAWLAIKSHYERVKGQLPSANEAQVEQLFVRPVLEALGYKDCYAVQPAVPSPEGEGPRRPDYAFFANPEDLAVAETTAKGKVEYFTKALAIGDAKAWDQSLDRKGKGGGFTNANPSYQIDYYIRATDRKWGILTNGRRWRLYHRDTSYRMNVFYEVDLVALLESYNEDFLYFFAFFRKEALTAGFLDRALTQSREYTATVGRELKENVYEALRLLAEGLLKCPDNHLTADHLEKIRENTFVLIYRILFLFYAEDRGLLPLENRDYRESYSLRNLAKDIAQKLDQGHVFSRTAYGLWAKLTELFRIVNEGDAWLGVPPYNGGLFDPDKHPDLVRWKVGDRYIAGAIDQLARAQAAGRTGRGPVNYRDLDIRDLGSIYEGLLEHRLRVATRDTAVVKDEDREVFVPLEKLENRRPLRIYRAGEVYLETDKGERRATGSYYTPDYIVQYIVDHTLGPLIEEKKRKIEEERKRLEEELKRARGQDREHYERKLRELDGRLIEEILSLKVLDPAMGSGHFLVGAMDFLARALIEALGGAPDESDEEDIRWARREVVERCLYGVDLNPLAVELAKLSLWIYTAAKDRPLSFLDHHLRVGNSLIGAWVKDLGRLPAKGKKDKAAAIGKHVVGLFEGKLKEKLPVVLGEVMELLRKPSDRVEDIRAKEVIYNRIQELIRPFKEVAHVWTATWFGVEVSEAEYEDMLLKLAEPPQVWENEVRSKSWFKSALEEAERRRFFHWELEFPEVFFDGDGRRTPDAGFHAVIGNPPYIRSVRLKEVDPATWEFYSTAYPVASKREYDVYMCFVQQGHQLLDATGRFGMILPNKWFTTQVGENLRRYLSTTRAISHIVDFRAFQVFQEVTTYTCLLFLTRLHNELIRFETLLEAAEDDQPLPGRAGYWRVSLLPGDNLGHQPWSLAPLGTGHLQERLGVLPRLRDIALVFQGTGTHADQVFLLERRGDMFYSALLNKVVELEEDIVKPALTGQDIDRYSLQVRKWLIFPYEMQAGHPCLISPHEMARRFPKAWAYLNNPTIRPLLEARDKGAFRGVTDWYAFGVPRNLDLVCRPKLVCPDVAVRAEFALDPTGLCIIDTCYGVLLREGVKIDPLFLLAVLNSGMLTWFLRQTGTILRGGYFRMKTAYLDPFPVPPVAFVTPLPERARLVREAEREYHTWIELSQKRSTGRGVPNGALRIVEESLSRKHLPDPELVRRHNADPLNKDWQIPEGALWERSDVVHDILAFLAKEMIRLNKEKHAEMKSFLSWLEAELRVQADQGSGTGIEVLTGKTRLKNYLGDYQKDESELPFEELWKILQKNKARIGRKLTHEFMAELRAAYDRSLAKLRPIKERLRLTDGLIDQIVYRLYGLTEEEIKLVEESKASWIRSEAQNGEDA